MRGLIPRLGLRSGGRSLTESKERHRARSVLLIVQVALALVLLVGSGLMIRTFRALRHVDAGFSTAAESRRYTSRFLKLRSRSPSVSFECKRKFSQKIDALAGVSKVGDDRRDPARRRLERSDLCAGSAEP